MTVINQIKSLAADLSGRVEQTEARLREAAQNAGYWISADGRIGEQDLAKLLGMPVATLVNRRREGRSPPFYRMGVRSGSRVSYRLDEVAKWIETSREQ